MKIYRKTYGVRNLVEWQANIPVGKGRLIVHFTGGSITAYGVTPAVFKTEDPIHQAIIENSGYFKSGRIFLMKSDFIKEVADPVPAVAPAPAASPAPAAAPVVSAPAPTVQAPAPAAAPAPTVEEKTETKQEPAKEEAPAAPAETTTPAAPAEETKQDPGTAPTPETVQTPAPAPAASPAPEGKESDGDEGTGNGGAVEAGTDEEGFKIVKASCFEDVRQYLIKNYGFTPSAVRTKALAKAKATANKVKFLIDGKELA